MIDRLIVSRRDRRALKAKNRSLPTALQEVPKRDWGHAPDGMLALWRSKEFLVQVYAGPSGDPGLITVSRTEIENGDWVDGISWDALQEIKNAVGFPDRWAVECFPPADAVVNVASMRHLWLLPTPPEYGWGQTTAAPLRSDLAPVSGIARDIDP